MFNTLFSRFLSPKSSAKEDAATRRRFTRRDCDKCVIVISDRIYPVENWSLGGCMLYGDNRAFGVNDEVDLTLKFKLSNSLIDVAHRARVVRKSNNKVALEFRPLTQKIRNCFQSVVDDYVAAEFADSQLA